MLVISAENEDNLLVVYELGTIMGMLLDYEPYVFASLEQPDTIK